MRPRVAGASTSQKIRTGAEPSARVIVETASSSSVSNTPTPEAFTTTSAAAACSSSGESVAGSLG